jgi:CDP-diacylglycerol--serine O-phosphatidyltransferase
MQLFNIPNLLTLINLFSGCMAIVFALTYRLDWIPYCVAVSLIADFFDGMAARALKTPQGVGKELDSLADVVSFGVLPSIVIFQLLFQYWETRNISEINNLALSLPAFFIALFAALRLAKFNLDERQISGFIGLATPAATIFVIGVLLVFLHNSFELSQVIFKPFTLYGIVAGLCYLMIAEIPMFSFKFKSLGWKGNEIQVIFILLVAVLLVTLKFAAIPLSVMLYVLLSLIQTLLKK